MNQFKTYEQLTEEARKTSIRCGYGAVCDVTNYYTGKGTTTVFGGKEPITNKATKMEFRGVACQFKNGQPYAV